MRIISGSWTLLALLHLGGERNPTPSLSAESEGFRKQVLTRQPVVEAAMQQAEKLLAYTKYNFSLL